MDRAGPGAGDPLHILSQALNVHDGECDDEGGEANVQRTAVDCTDL